MKAREKIDPSLDGIDGDPNLAREIGIDQLLCAALTENLHQCFQSSEIRYPSHLAQVFARQLFISKGTPPASEPGVAAKKWFWKSPMFPQCVPVSRADFLGSVNLSLREVRSQAFRDAPGMHAVEKVTTHQAVPATAEYVDARASRDDEAHSVAVAVEEALQ